MIDGGVDGGAATPLRWGVLSTASLNDKFLGAAARSVGAEVVAVARCSQAKADAYVARWDIPGAHGSYDGLLADDLVEAVYISLLTGLRHRWTLRALDAGKHVLCEKPYSRWPAEADEAFDAAGRRGLVLSEASYPPPRSQPPGSGRRPEEHHCGRSLALCESMAHSAPNENGDGRARAAGRLLPARDGGIRQSRPCQAEQIAGSRRCARSGSRSGCALPGAETGRPVSVQADEMRRQ